MDRARADGTPWRPTAGGVALRVRVTPRAARDGVEGIEPTADGPALKVRVRAVPDKGEANAAVEAAVARWLGIGKSAVTLASGGKSRVKVLAVTGATDALVARLAALVGPGASR